MWVLLQTALSAPCEPAALGPVLSRAENAYLKGDAATLKAEVRAAWAASGCEGLTPEIASRLHRAAALEHALANDWASAEVDLRASLAAQPLVPLDAGLAADPRLSAAWQRAQEQPTVWTLKGRGLVNGLDTALRPDTPILSRGGGGGGARQGLRIGAVATGAVAGGLYAGAWVARGRYTELAGGEKGPVVAAHTTTNVLSASSLGAAVVASGLLGASFAF